MMLAASQTNYRHFSSKKHPNDFKLRDEETKGPSESESLKDALYSRLSGFLDKKEGDHDGAGGGQAASSSTQTVND